MLLDQFNDARSWATGNMACLKMLSCVGIVGSFVKIAVKYGVNSSGQLRPSLLNEVDANEFNNQKIVGALAVRETVIVNQDSRSNNFCEMKVIPIRTIFWRKINLIKHFPGET